MGSVPPIQPPPSGGEPGMDPYVAQFKYLWDSWWENPTKKNAEALLNFLKDPRVAQDFAKNAQGRVPPYAGSNYIRDYLDAISSLKDWIIAGSDPKRAQIASEFIKNIWLWQINPRGPFSPQSSPAIEQFQTFFESWSSNPTKEKGEVLLAFLEDPKIERALMHHAEQKQIAYPEAQFARDYRYAVGALNDWLESGAKPLDAPTAQQHLSNLSSWLT